MNDQIMERIRERERELGIINYNEEYIPSSDTKVDRVPKIGIN